MIAANADHGDVSLADDLDDIGPHRALEIEQDSIAGAVDQLDDGASFLVLVGEAGVSDALSVDDLLLPEGKRPQRLGEQLERLDVHGRLAGPRAEQVAAHSDDVAEIQMLEVSESLLAEIVAPEVELHAPTHVGEVRERRLALRAPTHDPSGDAHGRAPFLIRREERDCVGGVVGAIEGVGERCNPRRLERGARARARSPRAGSRRCGRHRGCTTARPPSDAESREPERLRHRARDEQPRVRPEQVDAARRYRRRRGEGDAARGLGHGAAVHHAHGLSQLLWRHVVEQHGVDADGEGFVQAGRACRPRPRS